MKYIYKDAFSEFCIYYFSSFHHILVFISYMQMNYIANHASLFLWMNSLSAFSQDLKEDLNSRPYGTTQTIEFISLHSCFQMFSFIAVKSFQQVCLWVNKSNGKAKAYLIATDNIQISKAM